MKFKLEKGKIILVDGPAVVSVRSGRCDAVGALLGKGNSVAIPKGKKIPVEAVAVSLVEVVGKEAKVVDLPERTIPDSWETLLKRMIKERPKSVFVIGEMDTGKSFFTTWVSNRLRRAGKKVAVLDLDIGQSDIGPPGFFGLSFLKKPVAFLPQASVDGLAFVGGHSPGLHFAPALGAFARIARTALSSSEICLINTAGWVQGDGGRAYKTAKMEICPPGLVVLMQRGTELEHLVAHLPAKKIARLHVSKSATFTSPDVRKLLREEISRTAMARSRTVTVKGFAVMGAYYGTGTPVVPPPSIAKTIIHIEKLSGWEGYLVVTRAGISGEERGAIAAEYKARIVWVEEDHEVGALVGLASAAGDGLGMGVVLSIDWKKRVARIRTPAGNAKAIRILQFGSLRLTPDGREAGFLTPGSM